MAHLVDKKVLRITSFLLAFLLVISIVLSNKIPVKAADYSAWAPIFDSTYYYSHCEEAKKYAGKNADKLWEYFVNVGIPRGDQASEEFNVFVYARNYPDLFNAFGTTFIKYYLHYINVGKAEGRNAKVLIASEPVATAAPPATSKTESVPTSSSYEQQVVDLVNRERAANGLGSVSSTAGLNSSAAARASEVANYFSHTRPDGSRCFSIFKNYGVTYRYAGENIAAGQRTPEEVVRAWMDSPGHRENILSGNFKHMGVGFVKAGDYGTAWVQMFTD